MRRIVFSAAVIALCLMVMILFVPSGQILPDALNAYYTGAPAMPLMPRATAYGAHLMCAAALGTILYIVLCRKEGRGLGGLPFCAASLALGLALSRAAYVLVNGSFYFYEADALAALRVWEGGMSMSGALLGAALCCVWFERRGTDTSNAAPALAMFAALARLGERAAHMGYGRDVAFENDFSVMDTFGAVLDVSRIEALFALLLFAALLILIFRKPARRKDALPLFFLLYGAAQILFESLRADQHMILGFVKVQQVFSLLFAGGAAALLLQKRKRALLALPLTAALAAAAFGLEKALDRLDLSPLLIYAVYLAALCAYVFAALWLAKVRPLTRTAVS